MGLLISLKHLVLIVAGLVAIFVVLIVLVLRIGKKSK